MKCNAKPNTAGSSMIADRLVRRFLFDITMLPYTSNIHFDIGNY